MEFFELIIFEGDLYQRGEFQADNFFFSFSLSLYEKFRGTWIFPSFYGK